jgi:hypothetical protein
MILTKRQNFIVATLVLVSLLAPCRYGVAFSFSWPPAFQTNRYPHGTALWGVRHGQENNGHVGHVGSISRRTVLLVPSAILPLMMMTMMMTTANPSDAVVMGAATQAARVKSWPGIESLEPMYELKLSLDAMVNGLQDPQNWPYIQKRLDKFFGGFIVSEKNFYFGVGLQYMNEIQYDKAELPNYVLLDKQARYDALERTMKNLENLKSVLAIGGSDAGTVQDFAQCSQGALASWFAMIPDQDVKAVEALFVNVKKADVNRDGRLTDDELVFLSINEQEIWKRRVAKFG